MPARNRVKPYIENGYYHLYNRGVEKRDIFLDTQDYNVFLSYLQDYLLPKDTDTFYQILSDLTASPTEKEDARKMLRMNNFSNDITMLAYCLMPNHFHFFIKQTKPNTIDSFMNSLGTRYTMYFNKKYKRVGSLYQGVYKAAPILNEAHYLYLSKYIHKQSYKTQPCSYEDYLGKKSTLWVKPDEVLSFFSKEHPNLSYEAFVKEQEIDLSFPTLEN